MSPKSLHVLATLLLVGLATAQDPNDLSALMTGMIAGKGQLEQQQREERERMTTETARIAAELATKKAGDVPKVDGKLPYYQADKIEENPEEKAARFNFDALQARYPRMPSSRMPPPIVMFASCPGSNSVMKAPYSAKGDGKKDDADAILKAANSNMPYVYLPPGVYRIAKTITLNKPIVFGAKAQLNVDQGKTLTITKRLQKWDSSTPMFGGKGTIKLAGEVDEVHPEWFKNWEDKETDSDSLQQAVNSCAGSCTIMLTGVYTLNKAWILKPNVGVFASNGADLWSAGTGEGVILSPGTYTRPLQFGKFINFNSFTIKIQGGVEGAEIQVTQIMSGGRGIIFAPDEGSKRVISNVYVTHLSVASGTQNTVSFQASATSNTINNCLVRANLVLTPGHANPAQPSAGLAIVGKAPPTLVSTSVVFQAFEAAQFARPTQLAMLRNSVAAVATGVVFRVESWGGGLTAAGAGKVVIGKFSNLRALVRMSGGIPTPQQLMEISGTNNKVTMAEVSSAGAEYVLSSNPNPATFNNGQATVSQVVYVKAPIQGTWAAGDTRTYYLQNAYASSAGGRIRCIPFRAGNTGIVCSSFQNSGTGTIGVQLKNTAGYDLPSWQIDHRFGVQIGP